MSEKTIHNIGDFEFVCDGGYVYARSYIGSTGEHSVATVPDSIEIDGKTILTIYNCHGCLSNTLVEKVVSFTNLQKLMNMPKLRKVTILEQNYQPLVLENIPGPVTIEYKKGILKLEPQYSTDEIGPIAGDGVHAIFGDEVESIGIVRGGHITLGKAMKSILALKKPEFGISADCSVTEYELPTRLDFLSPIPPTVGSVAPGAMSTTEIHVPNGALEAYVSHPQWGKAAYIVEDGGKVIDNYSSKHKARQKKLEKDAKAAHIKAKAEKMRAMTESANAMLAPHKLAAWNPEIKESCSHFEVTVHVGPLTYNLIIPKDTSLDLWDTLASKLTAAQILMAQ